MSFFSPHYEAPFAPPFEQEPFDKKVNFFPSISDDPFSNVRQDFARIFHENNLDAFANPGDFGLPEKTEMGLDAFNGPASRPRGPSFNLNPLAFPPRDINMGNPYNTINYGNGNINKFTGRFQEDQYQQYEPINNMIKRDLSPIRDYPDTFVDDPLSHMWSSDPAGELKNVMNQQNSSQFYTSMDILNGALGFQTYNRNPSFPYVNSHMANLLAQAQVIEKPPVAMPKEELKLAKNKKSAYKEKSSTDASVKLEKSSNQSLHPIKDASGKLSDDEDGLEDFCGEKGRSLKGLRVLSQRVKQIVIEKQKTTYKEVAEMLIKEVVTLSKTKTASESKDEQNVKRRVYDALNVLIATGILKKEGKTVVCHEIYQSAAPAIPLKAKGEKERNRPFSHKIAEAQNRKKEKVDALNELLYKTLALKNLIKMNKEKAGHQLLTKNGPNSFGTQRLSAQGAQHAVPSNSQETIKFPFLVIESTTPENSMNLNLDQSQKELLVESTHELKIYGDVDILLKMKLHNVSRGFFEEQIPKALQKYVPSTFLDSLA